MKNIIFSILLFCCSFLFFGCPNEKPPIIPAEPTNCEYPAGNRNFTWRLDTVAWFPSTLGGIHAFSDSDAYLMGNIFQRPNGISTGYLGLHWNGKKWDTNINGTVEEIKHVANDATGDDHFMVSVGNWSITPPKPALGEFDNNNKKWKGYQFQTQGELCSVWTDGKGYFIAVGDNGMVYTKDGYTAEWVYQKAPTEFNFIKVSGVSKNEIYLSAGLSLASGEYYSQIWKYYNTNWFKLMDNKDSTGTPIQLTKSVNGNIVNEIAAYRCSITDSLLLIIVGSESFELRSKGNSNEFSKVNLSLYGLPLTSLHKTGLYITLFSPKNYWISSAFYDLYHWNGSNYKKMEPIVGLPYGQPWGVVSRIKKNNSGKTWILLEMASQVYAVIQGTP